MSHIAPTTAIVSCQTDVVSSRTTFLADQSKLINDITKGLTNGTWLGMVIVGFLWLLLGLYALILKNSDVYSEDYDTYDFKDDVPMAKTATDTTAVGRSSGIPEPPKHTSMMSPYMIPHRDFANQSQETYYYSTQGTPVYDYNNSDMYMNSMPVEDHSLYKATSPLQQQYQSPANGFERQRKVSKTYLEEEDGELAPPSASAHSQEQPPHSYDGDRL